MHHSVVVFAKRVLTEERVNAKRVVELGAQDVNGSLRPHVESLGPASYIGIDQSPGRGVDVVCDIARLPPPKRGADLVICTEVLEHARDWRAAVAAVKGAARVGGHLLVTARGPGFPRHDYPEDHWRFTVGDFDRIFADCAGVEVVEDPQAGHPGVLAIYRKRKTTVDLTKIHVARAPRS